MAIKKSITKIPLTETQLVFEKLKTEISQTLAPRLVGLLKEFGYESVDITSGGHRATVSIQELTDYINMDAKGWMLRLGGKPINSHNSLLNILDRLKDAIEHLMKIRNRAEHYLVWIGRIGSVEKRVVLIEKFKKKKSR